MKVVLPPRLLVVLVLVLVIERSACTLGSASARANASKPHILFVVVDDHGWHDCGFTGSEVNTPTIDQLRSQGIALNQYYVQKVCVCACK